MLERSDIAENALQCLHDEDYDRPFNTQNLNADTLIFSGGRQGRSLDGEWYFCVDLLDTGLRQKWFAMTPARPEDRIEPWDYDPHDGETVPVPSNWQMLKEKWYFFEGSAWYTRPVTVDALDEGRRRFLRIGAAQPRARGRRGPTRARAVRRDAPRVRGDVRLERLRRLRHRRAGDA